MNFGEYRRTLPRLQIRKGYWGNESMALQLSAPVTAAVTILSGQVIYLTAANTWSLATSVLCDGVATPYIALQDSVDTDVLSSGLLLGLSFAGQYVFETGYYVRTDGTFNVNDAPLIIHATIAGSLTLAVTPGGGSSPWETAHDIIGVTAMGGEEQVGPSTNAAGAFIPAINTEALPLGGPTYMLPFTAKWMPKRTVAA
jgi:hypothetical protein